jgi:tetratricopeptide (TPR) repeat protein
MYTTTPPCGSRVAFPQGVLSVMLVAGILALGAPIRADAQPNTDAKSHYQNGKALAASGRYVEAYREFEAGYAKDPRPAFLFNMGEAARGMGDVAKARAAYEKFLVAEPTGDTAALARTRLKELPPALAPAPAPAAPAAPTTVPAAAAGMIPAPHEAAVRFEARVTGALPEAGAHGASQPIWKKWPFWAAVGGVVITGIVVAVATRDGGAPCSGGCIDLRD